jgi:hypothetical protein
MLEKRLAAPLAWHLPIRPGGRAVTVRMAYRKRTLGAYEARKARSIVSLKLITGYLIDWVAGRAPNVRAELGICCGASTRVGLVKASFEVSTLSHREPI